jgi:Tfp pilus assembly protein PilF
LSELAQQALAALERGDLQQAARALGEHLKTSPRDHGAWYWLALVHVRGGRADLAVPEIGQALALDRRNADYHNLHGVVLAECGEHEQALQCFRRALNIRPVLADAHFNLGKVLRKQGRGGEALEALARARKLDPARADVLETLGRALVEAGRIEEAHREYAAFAQAQPRDAEAQCLLATTSVFVEGVAVAEAIYRRAAVLHPRDERLHWEYARFLLATGRLAEGWQESVWRPTRASHAPAPRPAEIEGKRVLLEQEQGIGDVVFFARFVPALRQRAARVMLRCEKKLAPFVARLGTFDDVLTDPVAAMALRPDFVFPLDDVPAILAPAVPAPSLRAAPRHPAVWRQRLAALGPRPYIALTWRAGTDNSKIPEYQRIADFMYKEASLPELGRALRELPGTLLAVQRLPRAGEVAALSAAAGREVHDFCALNDDLEEMGELLSAIDDYVGVSNTNMHLAAALGRSARVLVPFPPDWRWMLEGEESPWFPGFRLYRQARDRSWASALEALRRDLAGARSG